MEYLFNLTNSELGDPSESSLFNVNTLQALVTLGQSTPNIISNRTESYGTGESDFNLTAWNETAITLGLNEPGSDSEYEIGQKRAYLIWLWMYTAKNITFERETSYQMGVIGKLGSEAFENSMTNMKLDFPMLTIAEQMNITVYNKTC